MVSTNLGSRSEIKCHLKRLFDSIQKENYSDAHDASHKLQYSINTYYLTRGRDNRKQFEELFSHLNYDLIYCVNCDMKIGVVLDRVVDVVNALREVTTDPIEKLKELYDEILSNYINIDVEHAHNLLDCFDEMRQLRSLVKQELGESPAWVYYCTALEQLAICESSMLRVVKSQKLPSSLLSELEGKFADLLASLNACLSPAALDEKKIHKAYQKGVSLEDLSFGSGLEETDLRTMLQNEELEEESE